MERRLWRHFDPLLLGAGILLSIYGIAMIYSASLNTTPPGISPLENPPFRQALYVSLGIGLMALAALADYRLYGQIAPLLYGVLIALLVWVLLLGQITYGARRWIELGSLPLQPSEIAKLIFIVVLAKYLSDHQEQIKGLRVLLTSLLMTMLPISLIYFQPDLGTIIVFLSIWLSMVVVAGARLLHLGSLALGGLLSSPLVYWLLLHSYMRERVLTFLDPSRDPLGTGYNVLQSEISVGSGGLWGKGWTLGTQSQLHFLRIQKTDFIFSVLGEEMGFLGAILLLGLFLLLLFRGLRAASLARESFGRLVATGIVSMILVQVFINVGVNVRLLPATGIPLPFISYGGSSLITLLVALGVLQSILLRHRKLEF